MHVSLDFVGRVGAAQWGAAAAFAWAWHHQRTAHRILAAIRLVFYSLGLHKLLNMLPYGVNCTFYNYTQYVL